MPVREIPVDMSATNLEIGGGAVMAFNRIEAGAFFMGSPPHEVGRGAFFRDPEILHRVTITRPYYIGVYKVTQAQYRAVTGTNPSGNYPGDPAPPPAGTNIGDDLPVNHLNFD